MMTHYSHLGVSWANMRTTIVLDDDTAAAIEELRRREHLGLSEAVNRLVRAGLLQRAERRPFRQQSQPMGALLDITNVAETLELLEGPTAR